MPTPATAKWPKPRSEDEFEDMVVDFLRLRWKDPHAIRNGRRGQGQGGVDVIGHPRWLNGGTAGAQCKNVASVTLKMVIDEVEKAKGFPGGLAEFLFVAAAERDAGLQAAVRQHFSAHPAPFDVAMAFWPDIVGDLSSNEALVRKHWPGFVEASASEDALTAPRWIGRDGVPETEVTECQGEVRVVCKGGTELFATELMSELARVAQTGGLGRRLSAVVTQGVRDPSRPYTYRAGWKPAGNVTEKIELEIEDGGHLSYRWAEFWNENVRLFRTDLMLESVVRALATHHALIELVARATGVMVPTGIMVRLAARASGRMILHDEKQLTEVKPLMALSESNPEWSVEVGSDWAKPWDAVAVRLVNRALTKFQMAKGPLTLHSGGDFIRIDQQILGEFAARVEGELGGRK